MKKNLNDRLTLFLFCALILTIVYIWYAYATGEFEQHNRWVETVDVNPQNIIASASDSDIFFWQNRHCTNRITIHNDCIKSVSFSHSGEFLAIGGLDSTVKVLSVKDKKIIKTLTGHTNASNKVAFDISDKYIISAGYDNKLLIWDWKKGEIIKELWHTSKHTDFDISKANVLAYIDSSCNLTLFSLSTLSAIKTLGQFCGSPAFIPHKNIIAQAEINQAVFKFTDINTGEALPILDIKKEDTQNEVSAFTFTPDGNYLVAGTWNNEIEIWDWQQRKMVRTLPASSEELTFNDKGQLITGSLDGSVKIWNWNDGKLEMVLGNGLLRDKLVGLLFSLLFLTFVSGFLALIASTENKLSSFVILCLLTVWSFGIVLPFYSARAKLTMVALIMFAWVTTVLSVLLYLSVWFSMWVVFTVPVTLICCYIQLLSGQNKKTTYWPLVINLMLWGYSIVRYFNWM